MAKLILPRYWGMGVVRRDWRRGREEMEVRSRQEPRDFQDMWIMSQSF